MSWIIQSLLNNREQIKENGDIESDEFNDLMIIEKAIDELVEKNLLNQEEIEFLSTYGDITYKNKTAKERLTLTKRFAKICERMAFYLGGYFTDDGYLSYMQDKYCLDEPQMDTLRTYIKSEYKHKLIRKPLNHE